MRNRRGIVKAVPVMLQTTNETEKEPGLKRDFVSCSRTQPLVSWRHDSRGRGRAVPCPEGRAGHDAHPCRYSPLPKATASSPPNICSSSRLPPRPVPSVPIAVDIEHFQSFERRIRTNRRDWWSAPPLLLASLSLPSPPFLSGPYFHSMALSDCGAAGTTTPGPRRVI